MDKLQEIKKFYKGCREEIPNARGTVITYEWVDWLIEKVEKQQTRLELIREQRNIFKEQLENAIKENTSLREKLKQKDEQIMKIVQMKKVIVQTQPLPESEVIKYLQEQIIVLRQDLNRYNTRTFTR